VPVTELPVVLALAILATSIIAAPSAPPEIADTTLCDLVNRPLEFANRHVRVRGTVEVGVLLGPRYGSAGMARLCRGGPSLHVRARLVHATIRQSDSIRRARGGRPAGPLADAIETGPAG